MIIYTASGPQLLPRVIDILAPLPKDQQEIMERSLQNSTIAWIGYHDTTVLGFAGVIPPTLLSDTAYLWMYTTPSFAKHRLVSVRYSHRLIADALRHYPILVGHCTQRSARWLRWLGATIRDEPGMPFEIRAR